MYSCLPSQALGPPFRSPSARADQTLVLPCSGAQNPNPSCLAGPRLFPQPWPAPSLAASGPSPRLPKPTSAFVLARSMALQSPQPSATGVHFDFCSALATQTRTAVPPSKLSPIPGPLAHMSPHFSSARKPCRAAGRFLPVPSAWLATPRRTPSQVHVPPLLVPCGTNPFLNGSSLQPALCPSLSYWLPYTGPPCTACGCRRGSARIYSASLPPPHCCRPTNHPCMLTGNVVNHMPAGGGGSLRCTRLHGRGSTSRRGFHNISCREGYPRAGLLHFRSQKVVNGLGYALSGSGKGKCQAQNCLREAVWRDCMKPNEAVLAVRWKRCSLQACPSGPALLQMHWQSRHRQ